MAASSGADVAALAAVARPDPALLRVLGAVCLLLDARPTWKTVKEELLRDWAGTLDRAGAVVPALVPPQVRARVDGIVAHPDFDVPFGENSTLDDGGKALAERLCAWVRAVRGVMEVAAQLVAANPVVYEGTHFVAGLGPAGEAAGGGPAWITVTASLRPGSPVHDMQPVNILQNTFSDRTHCIAQLPYGLDPHSC